ncbi:MAG: hypothetical protein QM756_41755 [Polyangiaceae bacterium]
MMLNTKKSVSRFLKFSLVATALALSGCGNDTGSSKLPGSAHDHDHGSDAVTVKKIGTPLQVSQVAGHPDVTQLAAFATGNKKLYLITPEKNLYEDFDWSNGANATRSQHSFDAHGEHFLVLDSTGMLHILETGATSADWSYKAGVQVVSAASITAGAKLTVSGLADTAFITDPVPAAGSDKIQVVDLEAGTLDTPIDLGFELSNAGIAWTGVKAEHDHAAPTAAHADHPGRLVVANADAGAGVNAYIHDLEDGSQSSLSLDYAAYAIYSSPGGRFALIAQRPATASHQVQIVDSGLTEASEAAPSLLSLKLLGNKPAHYRSVDDVATFFFDGTVGISDLRFVLFNDESLAAGTVLASESSIAGHHGVAEPRGDVVIVSKADSTGARTGVQLLHRHDDHFHEEGEVTESCSGLHGAGSNANWSAFGCADGVLVLGLAEDDHEGHSH